MQDRYLFRGKRIDNGEWVHGYLFDDGFENGRVFIGGIVIEKYNGTACDDWNVTGINFYEIDPNTICQCTGHKDKNSNLICENDIVKDKNGNLYKAFWRDNYYQFSWICIKSNSLPVGAKWDFYSIKSFEIEVVGNVFDNPELLEVHE